MNDTHPDSQYGLKELMSPYYSPYPSSPSYYPSSPSYYLSSPSPYPPSPSDVGLVVRQFFNTENITRLGGGKSGDLVWKISINNTEYIVKTSSDSKLLVEFETTKTVYDRFKPDDQDAKDDQDDEIPVVKPYEGGEFDIRGHTVYFYRMDFLGPDKYTGLDVFLTTENYTVDVIEVFKNWFNFIVNMRLHGFRHCDLHPQNILVNIEKKSIKVIDFGEGRIEHKPCRLLRNATMISIDTAKKMNKPDTVLDKIVSGFNNLHMFNYGGDVDIGMFLYIFKVVFKINKNSTYNKQLESLSESYDKDKNTEILKRLSALIDQIMENYIANQIVE